MLVLGLFYQCIWIELFALCPSLWSCPYYSDFPFELFTIAANNTGILMMAMERTIAGSSTINKPRFGPHPAVLQHSFRAACVHHAVPKGITPPGLKGSSD